LIIFDFNTNCSGLEFITLIVVLRSVGFSNSVMITVETPSGDLISFIMTGGFAPHLRLNSYKIYPISLLIKHTEALSSPTSSGKYSNK